MSGKNFHFWRNLRRSCSRLFSTKQRHRCQWLNRTGDSPDHEGNVLSLSLCLSFSLSLCLPVSMSPCLSVALSPCLCLSVSHSQKCILKHTQNSFSPYFCTTTILSSILCDAFHKNGKVYLKPTQCQPDFKTQSNRATKTRFLSRLTKGESQIKTPNYSFTSLSKYLL